MSNIKSFQRISSCLLILLLAVGCQSAQANLPPPSVTTAKTTPIPLLTPSNTLVPSPTATSTITPSPTATLHPLTIESLRMISFPGSPITFEQRLENGANHERHLVSYQSEGLKIYALMTIPLGDPPPGGFPAIIFNHGYIPPREYRTTERYVAYVNGFASRGYVVFRPDYRGHGNSEGEARGAYSNPDYTIDVLNALASVRAYPQVNPEKIGMWGHSMGGHLTLRSMVVSPHIRAGVIWAGVIGSYEDMMYRWRATPVPTISATSRRFARQLIETYGSPEQNPSFWDSISPINFVSALSGPIQLHHAVEDSVVPVYFSERVYAAAQAAGMPVEFYTYAGDDHNIANAFSLAMQRSIDFFDRYLK
ncbi:MAG: alpha/beta fold hydrolase [Bellilinea sp.]|jgi:dipeptidyl aminopeptidase/acylaminoacyl peptidase